MNISRVIRERFFVWSVILLLVPVGLVACGSSDPAGPPGPEAEQFSILMIGNSLTYSNELPDLLFFLLDDLQEDEVYIESVAFPNYGLEDHWAEGTGRARIAMGSWDVVIIQQGPSATTGRPSLLEFSPLFGEEIRAAGAVPALFSVWPARNRPFDFDGVLDSYATAAETVNGYLFPAGEGWRAGWEEDSELPFYDVDGFHPSILGSYMAALIMAQQLTGGDLTILEPVIKSPAGTLELGQPLADLLHAAAHKAATESGRLPAPVN